MCKCKEKKGLVPCLGKHCGRIGLVLIRGSDNPLTELTGIHGQQYKPTEIQWNPGEALDFVLWNRVDLAHLHLYLADTGWHLITVFSVLSPLLSFQTHLSFFFLLDFILQAC